MINKTEQVKVGDVFGRLTVISVYQSGGGYSTVCRCECGVTRNYAASYIKLSTVNSCGCLRRELLSKRMTKHSHARTKIYMAWARMRYVCDCKKSEKYPIYGGIGIGYPESWNCFENFLKDMGEMPEKSVLARIDKTKGFSKENCKWLSKKDSSSTIKASKKNAKIWVINGIEYLGLDDASKATGIAKQKIWYCAKTGKDGFFVKEV